MKYKKNDEEVNSYYNFATIYGMIPIRYNKKGEMLDKKNTALAFFKSILEKRMIDKQQVFEYFKDLILCHYFERYKTYKNIKSVGKFDFCIEKAVYQYAALIHILRQLKLFKNDKIENTMENQEKVTLPSSEVKKTYLEHIEVFLDKMQYSSPQRAMFFLGRILNWIAFAQESKDHSSKPVLGKLNYNGLNYTSIRNLKKDLFLKMKQYWQFRDKKGKTYNLFHTCEPLFTQFEKYFELEHKNPDTWTMSKEEALFYVMSGYSYRAPIEDSDPPTIGDDDNSNENNEN